MKKGLKEAFTLIELLVVLVILSIVLFIASPGLVKSVNPQKTKSFVLRLQNTLNYLIDKSILEKNVYLFTFDIDERKYYFNVSEEGNPAGSVKDRVLVPVNFPEKLKVDSVKIIPGDMVYDKKVVIPFTPNGMLYSFEIVFDLDNDNYYVLKGNSIRSKVQLFKVRGDEEELYNK